MTKQDTYQVLATLQAFYPDSFRGMTDSAAQLKVTLWQEQFADEPATFPFPPSWIRSYWRPLTKRHGRTGLSVCADG